MENISRKFNKKQIKASLEKENEFISDLLITFDVPDSVQEDDEDLYLTNSKNSIKPVNKHIANTNKVLDNEAEERKEVIINKLRSKKSKTSSRAIKKREKKGLNKKLVAGFKNIKAIKAEENEEKKLKNTKAIKAEEKKFSPDQKEKLVKHSEPVFNVDGKMVFSKFDFAPHPGGKAKKSKKDKVMKNPAELLKTIKEQKRTISNLIEEGDKEKALEIKKQLAWKKALDKTEGKKVKDDPSLLLRAVRKKKNIKKQSKKKWAERKEKVEQNIAKVQQKRQENLNKRIKDKRVKKLKRLSKRGKVIPGY